MITTERLVLRAYTLDDAEKIQTYVGVADNVKYMLFGPNSIEETRDWVSYAVSANKHTERGKFDYVVTLKETEQVIGQGGLALTNDFTGEVGWVFHRDYWGQGYCTEFAHALLTFGFEELKLLRVVAHCDTENVGSYRVMEKCGMVREGLFRQSRRSNIVLGKVLRDEYAYAILAEDYFANTSSLNATGLS